MPFVNQDVVPKAKTVRFLPKVQSRNLIRDGHASRTNISAASGGCATSAIDWGSPQHNYYSTGIGVSSGFEFDSRVQHRTAVSSRATRQSSEDLIEFDERANLREQSLELDLQNRGSAQSNVRFVPKPRVAAQSSAVNRNVPINPRSYNTSTARKTQSNINSVSSNIQVSSSNNVRRSVIGALAINDQSQAGTDEGFVTVCGLVIAKGTPRSFRLVSESGIVLRHLLAFTVRDSPTDFVNVFCWAPLEFLARLTSSFHINDVVELQAVSVQPRNTSASSNGRAVRTSSRFELIFKEKRSSLIVHPLQSAEVIRLKYLVHLPLPAMVSGFDEKTCTQLTQTRTADSGLTTSDLQSCICFTSNACLRCLSRFALNYMMKVPSDKPSQGGPTTVFTNISVLAAVESVGRKFEVTTKKNERLWLVNARLLDTTCRMFRIALWGEELCRIAESWVPMNTVISIRDCALQYDQYSGPSLTSGAATVIICDPELSAATELLQFALSVNLVSQANDSASNQFIPGIVKVSSIASLSQLFATSQPSSVCGAKKWNAPTEHFIIYAVVTRCNVNEVDSGVEDDPANLLVELDDYQTPFKMSEGDRSWPQQSSLTGSAKRLEFTGSKSNGSLISMRCSECSQIQRFCRCRFKREKRALIAAKDSLDLMDTTDDELMSGFSTQRLTSRVYEDQAAGTTSSRPSDCNAKHATQNESTFVKQFDLCLHLTDHTGTLPYVRVRDQQLIGRILQCGSVEEFLQMNAEQRAICRSRLLLERFRFTLKVNMFVSGCLKPKIEVVDIRCIENSGAAEFVRFILAE